MQRHEITTEVTVTVTSHAIWPDDYYDMTLTEAMAYEEERAHEDDIYELIDFSDHAVVGKVNVRAVENNES